MKKLLVCIYILLLPGMQVFCETGIHTTFSLGSIGLTGIMTNTPEYGGGFWGSILDVYCLHEKSGLGCEMSPFTVFAGNELRMNFINVALFHQTFRIAENTTLGPFIGINWLDFIENEPVYRAGLQFKWRGELTTQAEQKKIAYYDPLLFNYCTVEFGTSWYDNAVHVYLVCTTDLSVLGPLIAACLIDEATKNTKKVNPDYATPSDNPKDAPPYNDLPN